MGKYLIAAVAAIAVCLMAGLIFAGRVRPTDADIVAFRCIQTGSQSDQYRACIVEPDAESGNLIAVYQRGIEGRRYSANADADFLKALREIMDEYDIWKWNGFNRKSSAILDGAGFEMEICFSDGKCVKVSGNTKFPKGYEEAMRDMDALFSGRMNADDTGAKDGV